MTLMDWYYDSSIEKKTSQHFFFDPHSSMMVEFQRYDGC